MIGNGRPDRLRLIERADIGDEVIAQADEAARRVVAAILLSPEDGWLRGLLSIEHEDVMLNSLEGLEKSIALLKSVMPTQASDYRHQAI